MLKLQVVLWHKTEMIWTDILEGANPPIFLREATDDFVFGDAEMTLGVEWEKVTDHTIDLEVLSLFELLQIGLSDQYFVSKRLR